MMPVRSRFLLLLGFLLSACSQVPEIHYYVLELPHQERTNAADSSGWSIGVRRFVVSPPYDQDRLAYRVGDASPEIDFYAYHRWAAPLGDMLEAATAAGLESTPGVREIEPRVSGRQYDAFLDGRLQHLEEVDLEGEQLIRLRLALRLTSAAGEELWSEVLEGEGSTQTDQVVVIVETMRSVLESTLAEARPTLARALRQATAGPD